MTPSVFIKLKNNSCEVKEFVELCKLFAILRSRVLRGLSGLMPGIQVRIPGRRKTKSDAAEFNEWVCLYFFKQYKNKKICCGFWILRAI